MRKLWWTAPALLLLSACASQPAEEQLRPHNIVQVCQGNYCVEQDKNVVTRQEQPSNPAEERKLAQLTALAEKDPRAAYDLALRLLRGDGVTRDSYQAIEWLRVAGNQGIADAQLALGRLYLYGLEEMGSDPAEAATWLSLAVSAGKKEARPLLKAAQKAKQQAHKDYEIDERVRNAWRTWSQSAPYYWSWGSSGWYLR